MWRKNKYILKKNDDKAIMQIKGRFLINLDKKRQDNSRGL